VTSSFCFSTARFPGFLLGNLVLAFFFFSFPPSSAIPASQQQRRQKIFFRSTTWREASLPLLLRDLHFPVAPLEEKP